MAPVSGGVGFELGRPDSRACLPKWNRNDIPGDAELSLGSKDVVSLAKNHFAFLPLG